MKSLAQLLAEWEAGTLSTEEVIELKGRLSTREGRAELVDDWLLDEAIYDSLRSQPTEAPGTTPASASVRLPRGKAVVRSARVRRPFFRWLVWYEARLSLRWPLGLALASCLLLLGVYFYYDRAAVGRLADVRAGVILEREGRKLSAGNGQSLYPGDLVRVPISGAATVAWADEPTRLELTASTDLQLHNPMRGKRFSLRTGRLQASVAPQPKWRPMTIVTPQAEARVVGTQFSLSTTGAVTRIEVLEGTVLFRKTRLAAMETLKEIMVHAGEIAGAVPGVKLEAKILTGFLSSDAWAVPPGTEFKNAPSSGKLLSSSQQTAGGASNAVERLRGYLVAPTTGDYTLWIAPFNETAAAELWLSSDEDPAHKRRIAHFSPAQRRGQSSPPPSPGKRVGLSAARQADWQRSPAQKSEPQKLVQGRRYYLEIWHEGASIRSLMLGWVVPGQTEPTQPRMVDLQALSPYVANPGTDARVLNN